MFALAELVSERMVMTMASTIIFCMDNPIETTLRDWMKYRNRASVGRDCDDHYEILAYSDNRSDFPELSRMAKKYKYKYIKSFISEGVTAID